MPHGHLRCRSTTLIELIIVIAIVSLLAVIALPNVAELRIRANRVRFDASAQAMRLGLEMRSVDTGLYPVSRPGFSGLEAATLLTTPVAYLAGYHTMDPFGGPARPPVGYAGLGPQARPRLDWAQPVGWMLASRGPSGTGTAFWSFEPEGLRLTPWLRTTRYDPTNGTLSRGNLYAVGGSVDAETRLIMVGDY